MLARLVPLDHEDKVQLLFSAAVVHSHKNGGRAKRGFCMRRLRFEGHFLRRVTARQQSKPSGRPPAQLAQITHTRRRTRASRREGIQMRRNIDERFMPARNDKHVRPIGQMGTKFRIASESGNSANNCR